MLSYQHKIVSNYLLIKTICTYPHMNGYTFYPFGVYT